MVTERNKQAVYLTCINYCSTLIDDKQLFLFIVTITIIMLIDNKQLFLFIVANIQDTPPTEAGPVASYKI